ncbi:DUF1622 domain-containing protein [Geodermatophilus sp. SYSU D01036]
MTSLGPVPGLLALAVSGLALVAGAVTLASTRRPRLALAVFLDLLLAAGLLRLAVEPTWSSVGTAAAVVALRRVIGAGLRAGGRVLSPPVVTRPGPDRWPPRP